MSVPEVIATTQGQPATFTCDDAWGKIKKELKDEMAETWKKTSEEYKKQSKETVDQVIAENVHRLTDPSKGTIISISPTPLTPLAQVSNNFINPVIEQSTKAVAHKAIDHSADKSVTKVANQAIDAGVNGSKSITFWGYGKFQAITGWLRGSTSEKKP